MRDLVGGFGRTKVILVLLLLVTCYVADWSDDLYSFSVASCYSAFREANPTLLKSYDGGGGGMNSSSMLTALAQLKNAGQERQASSGLESVFGSPLGSSSSNSSQAQSARLRAPFDGVSADDTGSSSAGSLTNRGGSGYNAARSPYGLTGLGSSSGLGAASGLSSGTSGISTSPY